MTFDYSWPGISWGAISAISICLGFFIFSLIYSKHRKKHRDEKDSMRAYGRFMLFVACFYVILAIATGLTVNNPSLLLMVPLAVVTFGMVFFDGHLTEKVVGRELAFEMNPIMSVLFRAFGFRWVRIGVLILMGGLLYWLVHEKDLLSIFVAFLLWIFVDTNNIMVLRKVNQRQKLLAETLPLEWGFEDMHEF